MSWVVVVIGYLLGSIPTAYFAGLLVQGKDIRQLGDANMGAANAYRQLGASTGILVGIVDVIKGVCSVLLASVASLPESMILLTGIAAVLGHNFPIFLRFRGGRGVSTTIGVLLVTYTLPILIMALPYLLVLWLTKNVTKAMAVLFVPLSVLGWWLALPILLVGYSVTLPVIISLTHFARIQLPKRWLNA